MTGSGSERFDAVVVGAGFAGLYMLHKLRSMGLRVCVFEVAEAVGGTWFWNCYPGARCDAESLAYSYSFSPDLEQQWEWTERYATQPEILRYIEHVAERFDLKRDIRFGTRVTAAHFVESTAQDTNGFWQIRAQATNSTQQTQVRATYCVMAAGCLSVPQLPDIPGIEDFSGDLYQASRWPHREIDFVGQRVGVIGTGSTSIQAIPVIAATAQSLTVFQRTANFSVPAVNAPLDANWVREYKANYRNHRDDCRHGRVSSFGDLVLPDDERGLIRETARDLPEAAVRAIYERQWQVGGARLIGTFADIMIDEPANAYVADFVREKIRETVRDPAVAELLCPRNHPIGTKRICVDSDYYATYNRDNVTLVDVSSTPIERITTQGVCVNGVAYELDALVLATGFDALTGPLLNIDIRGNGAQLLATKWAAGPRSYLGLAINGFPNLFTITGPGSPSVLSNMIVSIEQHVEWIAKVIQHMRDRGFARVEASIEAEDEWVEHVNTVAAATLFPKGGSWYLGANVPGKPRVFMPYAGGVGPYREICDEVANTGYEGFVLSA